LAKHSREKARTSRLPFSAEERTGVEREHLPPRAGTPGGLVSVSNMEMEKMGKYSISVVQFV
jgi:hypothetical protein